MRGWFLMRSAVAGCAHAAECFVIDKRGLGRMLAADRALRIFADLQNAHVVLVRHGVEVNHLAYQRSSRTDDQLDRLERLDRSNQARNRAEHASFGARGRHIRWRRLGINASVAGASLVRIEDRGVALEAEDRAIHQWPFS